MTSSPMSSPEGSWERILVPDMLGRLIHREILILDDEVDRFFETSAFRMDTMLLNIPRPRSPRFDFSHWLSAVVPDCYVTQVVWILEDLFGSELKGMPYSGMHADYVGLVGFLHFRLRERLQPIPLADREGTRNLYCEHIELVL